MLLFLSSVAAACPSPAILAELDVFLGRAEIAYANLDATGFLAAVQELDERVPCLVVTPDAPRVARLHRVFGLAEWLRRRGDRAALAFAAARPLDPEYRFEFLPMDAPERAALDRVSPTPPRTVKVPAPTSGALRFDVTTGNERPADRPTLFQHVDADDAVRAAAYLWPEDPLPAYPTDAPRRARRAVGLGSGALVVAGGALLATGVVLSQGDAYQELVAWKHPDAGEYWSGTLLPLYVGGVAAMGLGGAGLVGLWATSDGRTASAGVRGSW